MSLQKNFRSGGQIKCGLNHVPVKRDLVLVPCTVSVLNFHTCSATAEALKHMDKEQNDKVIPSIPVSSYDTSCMIYDIQHLIAQYSHLRTVCPLEQ